MRRRRDSEERGAVLVETSLVIIFLTFLGIGIAEIGFAAVDQLTAANAAREGARVGAAMGTEDDLGNPIPDDDPILLVVEQAMCNIDFGELQEVVVYKADADGNNTLGSENVYRPGAGGPDCANRATHNLQTISANWLPSARDNRLPGLDDIGVEVVYTHDWALDLFQWFGTSVFSDRAVMRIEPEVRG